MISIYFSIILESASNCKNTPTWRDFALFYWNSWYNVWNFMTHHDEEENDDEEEKCRFFMFDFCTHAYVSGINFC